MDSSTGTALAAAVRANSALPATSASSSQPSSPPHRFSAEAAPFVPSYMRDPVLPAAAAPVELAPQETSSAAGLGDGECGGEGDDTDRRRFSKMWVYCLEQMQGHEVGMLMDMMPPDIQELYSDKLSDEYLLNQHEHNDKGAHALCAVQKMVQELTPEQFDHIEEFLEETDALNPEVKRCRRKEGHPPGDGDNLEEDDSAADGGEDLFMHDDDGMGSEEEEWLLEQMMATGDKASAASK
ncbi:hypothetical protein LSCM4_01508 [Leishmania orientalis]|uniref:Uncharacterized protein n=1 Tax=Leishmania orientalis TaxID=2249476 RepID=A0A836KI11_9TRYP|nr:hypothetical protein LSCM4_01508 [Leishmania orientalis]